ncbi:LOW QUALITY PROTEIN: killer cell lectin-like receptor subfamily G member 1 [Rhynchonycteris naso]
MEMVDNVVYSALEWPAAPQAQNDCRPQQKDIAKLSSQEVVTIYNYSPLTHETVLSLSCRVAITLGILSVILVSLLLFTNYSLLIDLIERKKETGISICSKDSTRASCPSCPDFWYCNHCYYFSMERKNWNSSLEFCLVRDSHLLIYIDNQEMNLLKSFLNEDFYWIGVRKNSDWRWEDGSVINSPRIISNSMVQKCGALNKNVPQVSSCEVSLPVCKKVRL